MIAPVDRLISQAQFMINEGVSDAEIMTRMYAERDIDTTIRDIDAALDAAKIRNSKLEAQNATPSQN